jgi:hypothetical protein
VTLLDARLTGDGWLYRFVGSETWYTAAEIGPVLDGVMHYSRIGDTLAAARYAAQQAETQR